MATNKIRYNIVILGPPPASGLGGISEVLPAYEEAISFIGVPWSYLIINDPRKAGGRWALWILQIPVLIRKITSAKKHNQTTILYAHPGAGVSLLRAGTLLFIGKAFGANTILHLHAGEVAGYLKNYFKRQLTRLVLKGAQSILVLTPWWNHLLKHHNLPQIIAVVPNPVTQSLINEGIVSFKTRISKQAASDTITILVMTRLVVGKGIQATLSSLSLLPKHYSLVIAGVGPLKNTLESQSKQLGIGQRVRFLGWISGQDRYQLLRDADIYCMPSNIDSFGMGYVEAMGFGLPVVAYDWGPISDIILDRKVGILVKNRDPGSIAHALLELGNSSTRHNMGRQGQLLIQEQFSTRVIYPKLEKVFDSLLENYSNTFNL